MHAPGKGIARSALPYRRTAPSWLKTTPEDVCEQICKLAKKGMTPSQIGVSLRDAHGIAQVKSVTGNKILRILKKNSELWYDGWIEWICISVERELTWNSPPGLSPEIPEDLYHLIKKAVAVRKHLERNRKDKGAKFRLILIESRIHRLSRYYKLSGQLAPNWK